MVSILKKVNDRLPSRVILSAFWASFWLLNGLDKFFNGEHFFGVTRDEKFIDYFAGLLLPSQLALTTLYAFGVAEVLLGLGFLYILIRRDAPPVLNRLNFKFSMLLFFAFSIGDILFGDRAELLEHGTFLVLVIVSFEFFLLVDRSRAEAAVGDRPFSGT